MSRVIIENCSDYELNNVYRALNKVFDKLGGIDKYIKPGMRVALKPNLVMKKKPGSAATTHPAIIYVLSDIIQKAGAKAVIVESPGGLYNEITLRGVYSVCGIERAARESGAELNYNLEEIEVPVPEGKILKKVTVIKPLVDADLIINLPKLKTHGQMVYTGAVKNMFGAVPGALKAEYHLRMPDYNNFADAIIDIFLSVKPTLNIMDAIVGMDGYGPTAGTPREIGLIVAGEDAFSLDLAALNLLEADPYSVPVIKNAIERGLVSGRLEDIKLICEEFSAYKIKDFNIPQADTLKAIEFYNKGILKFLIKALRPKPEIRLSNCISCSDCIKNCPAKVIEMYREKPRINMSKCIRCFCCQELCPAKAISIKRPFISKILVKKAKK